MDQIEENDVMMTEVFSRGKKNNRLQKNLSQ